MFVDCIPKIEQIHGILAGSTRASGFSVIMGFLPLTFSILPILLIGFLFFLIAFISLSLHFVFSTLRWGRRRNIFTNLATFGAAWHIGKNMSINLLRRFHVLGKGRIGKMDFVFGVPHC